jgi:hypothetical protein
MKTSRKARQDSPAAFTLMPAQPRETGRTTRIFMPIITYVSPSGIAAEGPETNSRLSCQIKMTEELDGIRIRLPGKQK